MIRVTYLEAHTVEVCPAFGALIGYWWEALCRVRNFTYLGRLLKAH